jgi:AcrR family transcriptional regulator
MAPSPTPSLTPARKTRAVGRAGRTRRREQILEAAVRLFAEHGYAGADTQRLADDLQVGKGTLYRYFRSKRELFLAAADRGMRQLRQAVDTASADVADPFDRIAAAVQAYLTFYAAFPDYAELLIQERAQFKDRKKATYFEHREINVKSWHAFYRDLIDAGRLRPLAPEHISDVFGNLVFGTMVANHFAGRTKPIPEQTRDILNVVFLGILSDTERPRLSADFREN